MPPPRFARAEDETLAYWESIDAFRTSLERNRDKPKYSFYDGYARARSASAAATHPTSRTKFAHEARSRQRHTPLTCVLCSHTRRAVGARSPPFATGLPHYGHILAGTIKVRERSRLRRIRAFLTIFARRNSSALRAHRTS